MIENVTRLLLICLCLTSLSCSRQAEFKESTIDSTPTKSLKADTSRSNPPTLSRLYEQIHRKIIAGKATLAEIKIVLTTDNVAFLTNVMHSLYSMRWHRGVHHLLDDMWALNREKNPELNWSHISKAPVRIALASTLCRIQPGNTYKQQDYIRSHKHDEHEFHIAQVVVAMGFINQPKDVPYLKKMADGENVYIAQSAITGLGLMNENAARDALVELYRKDKGTNKGKLIAEVLKKSFGWTPTQSESD